MNVWRCYFEDGPLADETRQFPAPGVEPPRRLDVLEEPDAINLELSFPKQRAELTPEDRCYVMVYQSGDGLIAYKWFDGTFECDFCSAKPAVWDYPGRDFTTDFSSPTPTGRPAAFASADKGWAACDVCHRVIQRTDRDRLLARALDALRKREPRMFTAAQRGNTEANIRQILDDFWANREGEPMRLVAGARE